MQRLLLHIISMPAYSLGKFIRRDSDLARYVAHAGHLARLQQAYEQAVPPALARSGRVVNLKQGKIVIHATSGAAATKIQQVVPRLVAVFRQSGAEVTQIQVKVQPTEPRPAQRAVAGGSLRDHEKQGLENLSSQLPETSPLKRALQRFVRQVRIKER
ncbi:MAG TPA: DciA family protein [Rhodocyclaceae bacterium]|nr:DciA family protein [Rhodocyclaceae bacterium]